MKKSMGKFIVLSLVVVLLVVGVLWFVRGGLAFVMLNRESEGSIVYTYEYNDVSFESELTPDEVSAVVDILNGKSLHSTLIAYPACGFDPEIAVIIGGVRYAVALDGCGTLVECHTLRYIDLSNDEIAVIHEIFEKRGGTFPCI